MEGANKSRRRRKRCQIYPHHLILLIRNGGWPGESTQNMESSNAAQPRMSSLSLFKALSFPLDKPHVQIYYVGVWLCLHLQSLDQLSHINGCKGQSDLAIKPQMTNISSCRSASLSILSEPCFLRLDKRDSPLSKRRTSVTRKCSWNKHTTWGLLFSGPSLFLQSGWAVTSSLHSTLLSCLRLDDAPSPRSHLLSSSTPAFFSSAWTRVTSSGIFTHFSLNQWLQ